MHGSAQEVLVDALTIIVTITIFNVSCSWVHTFLSLLIDFSILNQFGVCGQGFAQEGIEM